MYRVLWCLKCIYPVHTSNGVCHTLYACTNTLRSNIRILCVCVTVCACILSNVHIDVCVCVCVCMCVCVFTHDQHVPRAGTYTCNTAFLPFDK